MFYRFPGNLQNLGNAQAGNYYLRKIQLLGTGNPECLFP